MQQEICLLINVKKLSTKCVNFYTVNKRKELVICGIVGMAGNLAYKDKDMLRMMLILCQLRGDDSTGLAVLEQGMQEPVTYKVMGDPSNMFETVFWDKLNLYNKSIIIGHTRKATVGGLSRYTAHPFTFDHITGVHNGTLRNWRYLPGETLATDSMTLYKNFAREGGVKDTIEQTDGAYALVWYDAEEGYLNFLRNKERPLFYAFNEAGDCMYWASEAWMIYMCAQRNGIKLMNLTPKEQYPSLTLEVDEDKWWKVRCKNASKDALVFVQPPEELKGDVKKPVSAPAPFQYQNGRYRSPWAWEEDENNASNRPRVIPPVTMPTVVESKSTGNSLVVSSQGASPSTQKDTRSRQPTLSLVANNRKSGSESSTSESQREVVDPLNDSVDDVGKREVFDNELKGTGDLVFTKEEFHTLVDPNCLWCKRPYTFEELKGDAKTPSKLGEWTDDDTFVCTACLKHINSVSM